MTSPVAGYAEMMRQALHLAAELVTAIEAAHQVLAPIAETDEAAGAAFEILADALASASPPAPLTRPVQVNT